jgi:hypothetical protein
MLWILTSLFFVWCAFREVRASIVAPAGFASPKPIDKQYLALVLVFATLFAWPPMRRWHFEGFLSTKATQLADYRPAKVHCNTTFDTMLDPAMLAAGHADPRTGKIGIQQPWCNRLMSYLSHPDHASEEEIFSLGMFTHESMHIRGELNEALTECESVQRNYRAAKLLGVPDEIARRNALEYYNVLYKRRGTIGGMQTAYYSEQCAPGKAWDEHLTDSTWAD